MLEGNVRVHIEGVGRKNNGPVFELEDTCAEFIKAVKKGLYRLEHEEGDARCKISIDVLVEYEKPVEVKQ